MGNSQFIFKSEIWIPMYTGYSAKTFNEFVSILSRIEPESIFYHVYINLFNYHNLPVYYPNSFAYWLYKNNFLITAEKLCAIDPIEFSSLEELRQTLLNVLSAAPETHKDVPLPNTFYFVKAAREVINCGYSAINLPELIEGIKKTSINSLFYHLISSRIQKKQKINDFSLFLISLGETRKAEKLNKIEVYNKTLYELREEILKILSE